MINRNIAFQLIVLVTGALLIIADHRNLLKLCKIECELDDYARPFVVNHSCSIKAISRSRSAIDAEFYVLRPLDDVWVRSNITENWERVVRSVKCFTRDAAKINMRIFKKNSIRYLPFMVNVTVDICKFLESKEQNNFYIKFMLNWINKYSNLNHSCPYSGRIFAEGLEPFADKIPVFVPPGDYRLELHFFEHDLRTRMLVIRGYGTITTRPFIIQGL